MVSEVVATQRAVAMCEATGSPIYVVHLSSERALRVCEEAQAHALPVYVETRPLYLHLTQERFLDPDGAVYVGSHPFARPTTLRLSGKDWAKAPFTQWPLTTPPGPANKSSIHP